MRSTARLIVAVAVAAVATGCGDEIGDYRADARKACASADGALADLGAKPSREQFDSAIRAWRRSLDELAALQPPDAERQRHAELVSDAEELDRSLRAAQRAVLSGKDVEKAHADVIRARSAADSVRTSARQAKVEGCGEAALNATDRTSLGTYDVIVTHYTREFERVLRGVDYLPDTPEEMFRDLNAIGDAEMTLRGAIGGIEAPRPVRDQHLELREAISKIGDVMLPLYTEENVTIRMGQRALRRIPAMSRRMDRAQRDLLEAVAKATG